MRPSPGLRRIIGVFIAQGTCLLTANVCPISAKRDVKNEANTVVSECTVCYHVVAH